LNNNISELDCKILIKDKYIKKTEIYSAIGLNCCLSFMKIGILLLFIKEHYRKGLAFVFKHLIRD